MKHVSLTCFTTVVWAARRGVGGSFDIIGGINGGVWVNVRLRETREFDVFHYGSLGSWEGCWGGRLLSLGYNWWCLGQT